MKRKKTGSPVFFLCLKFSTYRIFSGKAKKFRLVIGIFEKKYFFQDMEGKRLLFNLALLGKRGKAALPLASPLGKKEHAVKSCVPLRGRGPRSGEGVLEGKYRKDTQRQSRPPFGGQDTCGVSYRYSASYTLCRFAAFAPVGSVSLDSQSPLAPYESSSLATSRGNKRLGRGSY